MLFQMGHVTFNASVSSSLKGPMTRITDLLGGSNEMPQARHLA